ncbi:enoyl-CoA hydratase [Pacificimonas flava]|uniref:Enoyl-CoA hydratase n=2 Tax=Pacificimonas TaxID=1960290 RepID=A0A219B1D7_9SPHN|nr:MULTISPECIES: enoyl-CoA hydratase-related protein [Pacificimonas]MBZ6378217.1 enoyl-CoA hydratase/isomerase family protein [Pacificimonas aurantium]OWV32157.1 enoyl-CoA hydratase [Pacificimonas flava]
MKTLELERDGGVERVTLDRPDKLNALNRTMVDELRDYFRGLSDRPEVRVVVLQANGRAFCAGLDLAPEGREEKGVGTNGPHQGLAWQRRIAEIYMAMRYCPQPIISLVNGAACGGGFSLALASDIRIASESARMNCAYIRIGLGGCDMASSYFLPRLVGASLASELILTGKFIDAQRAHALGLVSKVVPDAELRSAADEDIDLMLTTNPLGLRMSKEAMRMNFDAPSLEHAIALEDRQQILLSQTEDAKEAGRAFFEKRRPNWKDA